MLKTCSKCLVSQPTTSFNRDKTKRDGLFSSCKECSRAACRDSYYTHHDSHRAMKKRWKAENPERVKELSKAYRLADPERGRLATAQYRERWRQATPSWVDLEQIKLVYKCRPKGFHVDHIHPLKGENFCGLNVPWNLQYLTAEEHWKKGTKLLASSGGCDNL